MRVKGQSLGRKKKAKAAAKVNRMDFLIVGLGNPGKEYETTRHNIGFIILDNFADKIGIEIANTGFHGIFGAGVHKGNKLYLLKPQTFMNKSGISVKEFINFYKIPTEQMIVVHDELDFEFKDVKVKFGGGTAGNKGIKSIIESIGAQDFYRVRIGIGKPEYKTQTNDHVLSSFSDEEFENLDTVVLEAIQGIETVLENWEKNKQN